MQIREIFNRSKMGLLGRELKTMKPEGKLVIKRLDYKVVKKLEELYKAKVNIKKLISKTILEYNIDNH